MIGEGHADKILIGAAIGAGLGAGVGSYMDAQEEKLARIPGTTVERVGSDKLLVRFSSDVLFDTDSAMLVKWRELNPTNPFAYQRAAYLLDSTGLKIKWGNFAASPAGAILPTLLPGDPCNNTTVLCYDHAGTWP